MSTYKHILVPTDFSEHSKRAVTKALELGKIFDAQLSVVHVVDYLPPAYITSRAEYTSAPQIMERATAYLAEWANEVGLKGAKQLVTSGTAGREIVATAKASGADLIAIGTSGEGGIKRLLGSTTTAVIHHAPCDVLSVHCD